MKHPFSYGMRACDILRYTSGAEMLLLGQVDEVCGSGCLFCIHENTEKSGHPTAGYARITMGPPRQASPNTGRI